MKRNRSLLRSALVAVPLGIISTVVGFVAYKTFHPATGNSTVSIGATDHEESHRGSWPDVQFLADSGLSPVTEEELKLCKDSLPLGIERDEPAHADNFGERDPRDAIGREIPNTPAIIVLHETVISEPATVELFQTPHPNDNDQASYHVLVGRSGETIRIVPDDKRAYGSGYSRFGDFTIHSKSPDNFSINNVALHVSLETPSDGRGDVTGHSGYTNQQYSSIAKQVLLWQAKYGIPIFRVTTHAWADRSHSRYDPRSFRWDIFDRFHRQYAATCGFKGLTLP